jgi:hypothetical protein
MWSEKLARDTHYLATAFSSYEKIKRVVNTAFKMNHKLKNELKKFLLSFEIINPATKCDCKEKN